MARAVSIDQLYKTKHKTLPFSGEWAAHIGQPEPGKTWIIWGDSSNGKTTYALMLAKILSPFMKVWYDSMEEGDSETMKVACKRVKMEEVKRRFVLLNNESIEELEARLNKNPKLSLAVFIDTVQYAELTFKKYKELKENYPNVLWIYLSHEEGKLPDGKVAQKIRRDAMVKIRVVGYRAFSTSRYGHTVPFTIWQEGAERFYGSDF